jgi:hypothetical protein
MMHHADSEELFQLDRIQGARIFIMIMEVMEAQPHLRIRPVRDPGENPDIEGETHQQSINQFI